MNGTGVCGTRSSAASKVRAKSFFRQIKSLQQVDIIKHKMTSPHKSVQLKSQSCYSVKISVCVTMPGTALVLQLTKMD